MKRYIRRPLRGLKMTENALLLCVSIHRGKEELIDLLLDPIRLILKIVSDIKEAFLEV